MRTHETRVHRKNYIPTEKVPRIIPTNVVNGHIYLSATVTWFVGNSSENSDGIPTTVTVISVNRNVVGSSSVYSDEFPTTTTVICFIGISSKSRRKIPTSHVSSEFRRKWPTEFRRLQFFVADAAFRKRTGLCLSGKELDLTFSTFWRLISDPDSRFEEVPQLVTGIPFKIYGLLKPKLLSPDTQYSAYVVYKAKDQIQDVQKSFGVGVIVHETPEGAKWERLELTKLEKREDGWVEANFGELLNDGGFMDDRDEIWFRISEIKYSYWTSGFIIQGSGL
ncbi:hypothetical protein F2Q68_00011282 [Brassica cretica]|uniref:Uncharacterized protein n=1 Tax=Brassica cretica TaxID=69181 RepID=A0A8S9L569_BRACR|nr:hypothetical protein F2Q68_00011282 [Brassica cretica]